MFINLSIEIVIGFRLCDCLCLALHVFTQFIYFIMYLFIYVLCYLIVGVIMWSTLVHQDMPQLIFIY